jgi:hypothetical protein
MVYNTQDYWVFGLPSIVWYSKNYGTRRFGNWSVSVTRWGGETPTLLGPLPLVQWLRLVIPLPCSPVVPEVGCFAPGGGKITYGGNKRQGAAQGAGGGPSERHVRLFTIEVTSEQSHLESGITSSSPSIHRIKNFVFFPLALQPQFGPWPTSMKLSVSLRFFF